MSAGPGAIIDADPALTFLARKDTTRILYAGLGTAKLLAPEQVEHEVVRKSRTEERRFGAAEATWKKIVAANRLTVLPDDETPELGAAVQRLCLMPMSKRMRQQQDLGELLVIAHAAVRAGAGEDIAVLIQERNGTLMATTSPGASIISAAPVASECGIPRPCCCVRQAALTCPTSRR